MSKHNRIYVVTDNDVNPATHRLVRAATQAQAVSHVVRNRYTADVATPESLVDLTKRGIEVEVAGETLPPAQPE
jgi:hypothetical protein